MEKAAPEERQRSSARTSPLSVSAQALKQKTRVVKKRTTRVLQKEQKQGHSTHRFRLNTGF